jgi:tRNA threonylcarbamoyl adenosine modification protein YeaZ
MPYLIIETSTEKGLIACLENQEILFAKEFPCGQNQSKYLMPELEACMKACSIHLNQLSCIGVGIGPGSYTGIRIGASVAQALAYGWNIPLVGISSLNGFVPLEDKRPFAALIDARIGGVYVRKGVADLAGIRFLSEPTVCPLEQLSELLEETSLLVTPNSQSLKIKIDRLLLERAFTWEERYPCVRSLSNSVQQAIARGESTYAGNLELMYLRKTEAERQREMLSNTSALFI